MVMNEGYRKYSYDPYTQFGGEKQSIERYLTNFNDFMDLLEVRRIYAKSGGVGNYYILHGKYWIDQFGQISKVIEGLDELKKYFDIPLVLTNDEFHEIMRKYNKKYWGKNVCFFHFR